MMNSYEVFIVLCAILSAVNGNAVKKLRTEKSRPFFINDNDCFEDPNLQLAPHQDCSKYWVCDEFGAFEVSCDPGMIFDTIELFCGRKKCFNFVQIWKCFLKLTGDRSEAICDHEGEYPDPEVPDPDDECPLNSDDVIFLPGDYCGKILNIELRSKKNIYKSSQSEIFYL